MEELKENCDSLSSLLQSKGLETNNRNPSSKPVWPLFFFEKIRAVLLKVVGKLSRFLSLLHLHFHEGNPPNYDNPSTHGKALWIDTNPKVNNLYIFIIVSLLNVHPSSFEDLEWTVRIVWFVSQCVHPQSKFKPILFVPLLIFMYTSGPCTK